MNLNNLKTDVICKYNDLIFGNIPPWESKYIDQPEFSLKNCIEMSKQIFPDQKEIIESIYEPDGISKRQLFIDIFLKTFIDLINIRLDIAELHYLENDEDMYDTISRFRRLKGI